MEKYATVCFEDGSIYVLTNHKGKYIKTSPNSSKVHGVITTRQEFDAALEGSKYAILYELLEELIGDNE